MKDQHQIEEELKMYEGSLQVGMTLLQAGDTDVTSFMAVGYAKGQIDALRWVLGLQLSGVDMLRLQGLDTEDIPPVDSDT